jgi:hypothetical protein
MRSTVRCECGAVYDREETQTMVRIREPFVCVVCGREIEPWLTSRKASFRLVRRPSPPRLVDNKD